MFGLELVFGATVAGLIGGLAKVCAEDAVSEAVRKTARSLGAKQIARIAGHWSLPENHDALKAIRTAQFDALLNAHEHDKRLVLAPALLRLMGRETANIHLGSRSRRDLETRLNRLNRDRQWFSTATERMVLCIRKDHAEWTSHFHES